MVPAGMEIMDRLSIGAVEAFVHAGYPTDAESLLLVELDGPTSEVEQQIGKLETLLRDSGAKELRVSTNEEDRLKLWAGRKAAFGAMGKVSADYYCMGGTIPRGKLPEVLGSYRRARQAFRIARSQRVSRRRRQSPPSGFCTTGMCPANWKRRRPWAPRS